MTPRAITVDQQWLQVLHKELHRLTLAVERIERRLRDSDSAGDGETVAGESSLDEAGEE